MSYQVSVRLNLAKIRDIFSGKADNTHMRISLAMKIKIIRKIIQRGKNVFFFNWKFLKKRIIPLLESQIRIKDNYYMFWITMNLNLICELAW